MRTQRISAVIFMLFSLAMFASSFMIEEHSFVKGLTAQFWPQFVTIVLFCLGMMLFAQAKTAQDPPAVPWSKIIVCMLFFLGYVLGLDLLGYVIATYLFQALFLRHMKITSLGGSIIFPAISTFVLLAGFKWALGVLLPVGVGIFQTINRLTWA